MSTRAEGSQNPFTPHEQIIVDTSLVFYRQAAELLDLGFESKKDPKIYPELVRIVVTPPVDQPLDLEGYWNVVSDLKDLSNQT